MKCPMENREGEGLLLDYVSGALDTLQAKPFEQHMQVCPACSELVKRQKAVWGALDVFQPAPISADFDRRLYRHIEQVSWWNRVIDAFRSPVLTQRGLPIVAAAAALAIAGFVWERPSPNLVKPQSPLSAEMDTIQPDQVQHALDDMEMLREFDRIMRTTSPAESKM